MRRIKCYECGRIYDYDQDDFCPRCGAFNQPPKTTRIDADGTVIRMDGLNENNHAGSFAHEELHAENRARRSTGLSKGIRRSASIQRTVSRPMAKIVDTAEKQRSSRKQAASGSKVFWFILVIILFNVFSRLLMRV